MRTADEVERVVRERYGEIARTGTPVPEAGCCGPRPATIAERIGYRAEEIAAAPEGANLGLGCGAPLDEYDSYCWPVLALLRRKAPRAELETYLRWAADEQMRSPVPAERLAAVLGKLMRLDTT